MIWSADPAVWRILCKSNKKLRNHRRSQKSTPLAASPSAGTVLDTSNHPKYCSVTIYIWPLSSDLQNYVIIICGWVNIATFSVEGGQDWRATEKETNYSETWANRGEWDSRVQDNLNTPNKTSWPKIDVKVQQIVSKIWGFMVEKSYVSRQEWDACLIALLITKSWERKNHFS